MKTIFFLIFTISALTSEIYSQTIYVDTTFNFSQVGFEDIHIIDTNIILLTGFATNPVRPLIYLRNVNGNWKKITNNQIDTGRFGYGAWGIDTAKILLLTSQKLYYTSNGGSNWSSILQPMFGYDFSSMKFSRINKGYGYIFSSSIFSTSKYFIIYKTTDFGVTWAKTDYVNTDTNYFGFPGINTSSVTDSLHYYIGLFNTPQSLSIPSKMIYSTSGGMFWNNSWFPGESYGISSVGFKYDNNTGIALGRNDTHTLFYKTTNRGVSWVMNYSEQAPAWDLNWISDSQIWYTSTEDKLIKSTNDGNSWFTITTPTTEGYFLQMDFFRKDNKIYGWLLANQNGARAILRIIDSVNTVGIQNILSYAPNGYSLKQNYPNPFNPMTSIEFDVPKNADIKITIFDVKGKEIRKIQEYKTKGTYKYIFDGNELPSGIYFYTFESEDFRDSKKMILLK